MTKTKLALISLALINMGIIAVLLKVRLHSKEHLEIVAQHLEDFGQKSIEHTVHINTTIPFETEIEVLEPIRVEVELLFNDEVRVRANIPVKDRIQVPIDFRATESIEIDTCIHVSAPRGANHPVGENPTRAIDCSP